MATKPLIVVVFVPETPLFWRRNPFSSSFCGGKLTFLVTTPVLVVAFGRRTHFFGDDIPYRRRFWTENPLFGDETPYRRRFCA
ncbi:hypothetical protein [Caldibacillus thermoamylovorans]|uniref:hypothetical protein n=1 Tax=Caldibacillus thermoamylovorans TaxID=35841 RepID=UPI00203DC97B|nr:hypothetical protein [Caldibacillus thermoamylovorans]MCM3054737.1 hypothetical protein [Caldibacillus thermoamylovorans]